MNRTAFPLSIILLLSACSLPKGDIDQKWIGAINEYGIRPIYPPKEDYFIGNIYLHVYTPGCEGKDGYETAGCDFVSVKIGHLPAENIQKLIANNYGKTWSFRADEDKCEIKLLPTSLDEAVEASEVPEAQDKRRSFIGRPTRECYASDVIQDPKSHMRLRRVGFPDFFKRKITGGSLAASLPFDSFPNLGFGVRGLESYSVSIPAAQYYAVNAVELASYIKANKNHMANKVQRLVDLGGDSTIFVAKSICEECGYKITIPYEIYYSSVFDIEYVGGFGSEFGATRSRGDQAYKVNVEKGSVDLDDLLASPVPGNYGVASKITHASDNRIGLRRIFDAPLAVGFRGMSFSLLEWDNWLAGDPNAMPSSSRALGNEAVFPSGTKVPKSLESYFCEKCPK